MSSGGEGWEAAWGAGVGGAGSPLRAGPQGL